MSSRPHEQRMRIVAALALACAGGFVGTAAAADNCDRSCLTGLITQYVDALVAQDASKLPLAAANIKITENSQTVKLGDGLWKTATGKGTFRHDYLDVKKQVAATHVVILEGQVQALYSVLLHVKDRRINGIETLLQRVDGQSRLRPTELGKPVRGMDDPVPAGKRMSREAMIRTALTYTEGLRVGSFIDAGTPFAPGTYRVENGVITAGEGCGRADCGMYAQNIIVHPGIIASVAAVDEENGVVLLWMNFGHTGSNYGEGNSLVTFEAFKVWDGQIQSISAFFLGLPISTARFWPSSDPVPR
ncbi:MAG TPA: hypothetical protein VMK82_01875 [Steroidobacteraceae bacterium]|nr:hypothetical protein [Steroidobacteraceae bacterium]